MQGIHLDISGTENFVTNEEIKAMEEEILKAHDMLQSKSGKGKEMLGWMDLPSNRDEDEIKRIKECASRIQKQSDVFVVIGIGGSYLGAKAIIDLFSNTFNNMLTYNQRKYPQIIFAGNNLSGKYLRNLVEYLEDKDFSINVISKSGKTLEPAVTFRTLRLVLEEKYGIRGACERIYVTTDKEKGILHDIAVKNEYEMFVIPNDIGGRYSVLTPVGLLPMAVANIEFEDILDGAQFASYLYNDRSLELNECYMYAAIRNILYRNGVNIELLASYEPSFKYFIEWFKQLFGESEGKENKGIFPAGVNYTTDLHSMGQMIQEGRRNIFETVINVEKDRSFITLPELENDDDGLNYLAGKDIDFINKQAFLGTVKAHVDGGVPNMIINIDDINEYNVGQLIVFFEKACAISGYVLGVNPFDQPGVEAYKTNMMDLLRKEN
ncbi:MAG: glucose-6-phosphate isomerase [Clostridia bacterium]|nr:glucose-6-phosphate isomerase [Clostridia bacterium]